MWKYNDYEELYHHGIKGQRWGRRRWQNKDGSLTPAGEKRYGSGDSDSSNYSSKSSSPIVLYRNRDNGVKTKVGSGLKRTDRVNDEFTDSNSSNDASKGSSPIVLYRNQGNMDTASRPSLKDKMAERKLNRLQNKDMKKAEEEYRESEKKKEEAKKTLFGDDDELNSRAKKDVEDRLKKIEEEETTSKVKKTEEVDKTKKTDEVDTAKTVKENKTKQSDDAISNDTRKEKAKEEQSKETSKEQTKEKPSKEKEYEVKDADGNVTGIKVVDKDGKHKEYKDVETLKERKTESKTKDVASEVADKKASSEKTNKNISGAKNVADTAKTGFDATRGITDAVSKYRQGKISAETRAELDTMSDKQLRDRINRIQMEQQYASLKPDKVQQGLNTASSVLSVMGSTAAVVSSGLGIALTIRKLLD